MKMIASHQTETFINQSGYYAIRQENSCLQCGDDTPSVIQLTPDQMRLLIADMEAFLENAEDWFSPEGQVI